MKRVILLTLSACMMSVALWAAPATNAKKPFIEDGVKPRVLSDYVEQDKDYWAYIRKNHPLYKYEKEGRMVGKLTESNRQEEFININNGPKAAKELGLEHASVTYRLFSESILDYPNKFVGAKKCGECHPAQYASWSRSRHTINVRFPHEVSEAPNGDLNAPMYGSKDSSILPKGISAEDVVFVLGTPRTKYGFIDKYLVRGTYHVQGGKLKDGTGTVHAGSNQFSRLWTNYLTPEMAKKIASYVPGFPTTLEEFGGKGSQGSYVWGTNSYGSTKDGKLMFQPATAYCEVCHSFKFDFKSKEEFFSALGNAKKLQEHTINKGITCEECHGAGGHLYGARGAGMPSNCERCHQRFANSEADEDKNPRKPFNTYFKSGCPSCGTEGSQLYNSAHYDKGMRCTTCHDPHETTMNSWKDNYTIPKLKKDCNDCHETQQTFFDKGGIHAKESCSACHMPTMMSCENFNSIQFPDHAGFDNARTSHIWKINVSPTAKTINQPKGKERDARKTKGWTIARDDNGRYFVDLMWSCGRSGFEDRHLVQEGKSGCHSAAQSTLPKDLHYTDQQKIYDDVVAWQKPVKDGYAQVKKMLADLDKKMAGKTSLKTESKARAIMFAKQAEDILTKLEKDGSWGVHGPAYSKKIIDEALVYVTQATDIANGKSK